MPEFKFQRPTEPSLNSFDGRLARVNRRMLPEHAEPDMPKHDFSPEENNTDQVTGALVERFGDQQANKAGQIAVEGSELVDSPEEHESKAA